MPYIKPVYKGVYEQGIQSLRQAFAGVGASGGELNYVLTSVALAWLTYHQPPYNYELRSATFKELQCAANEFYRRVLANYEDKKIEENGDVFPREVL